MTNMKTVQRLSLAIAVTGGVLLNGCGEVSSRLGIDPRPEVRANVHVAQSFAVKEIAHDQLANSNADHSLSVDRARIVIKKSALEREFLLMASLIVQAPVHSFNGLKGRVVAFRQVEDRVYAMEATQGHVINSALDHTLILTSFPILEETNDALMIDFNEGMSRIFIAEGWRASDLSGRGADLDWQSVKVRHSFIDSAYFSEANQLVIRQIAQVSSAGESLPVEARYYLQPYDPDTSFEPLEVFDHDTFGFFEVSPQLNASGTTFVRATHFHPKKPIVFAISANTPAEYRQAVKDGILYWNKAFGREAVQAVQLEDASITAPNPQYNVVQWVDWDSAGGAYADAQMDPRSGEILHAQVFLTSTFAAGGKLRGQRLMRQSGSETKQAAPRLSLAGFESESLCDYDHRGAFENSLATIMEASANQDVILKFAQAYVAEVVAHEIGHTLGLRHNFAGSLAANYELKDREQIVKQLIENPEAVKGVVPSSSVMEYQAFEESVITGLFFADPKVPALSYDALAVQRLYEKREFERNQVPPFCTDSHAEKGFLDCVRFDLGRSVFEYAQWAVQNSVGKRAHTLMTQFISGKAPSSEGERSYPVEEVRLNPVGDATATMSVRYSVFQGLTKEGLMWKVRRAFPFINSLFDEEVMGAEAQYSSDELKRLGGLGEVIATTPDGLSGDLVKQFDKLLSSPDYTSGFNGLRKFSFSEAEKQVMRSRVELYALKYQERLILEDLKSLSGNDMSGKEKPERLLRDHDLSFELADLLARRLEKYVFEKTGNVTVYEVLVEDEEKKEPKADHAEEVAPTHKSLTVSLPEYKYSTGIRKAAAGLFKAKALSPEWGYVERAVYKEKLTKEIEAALQGKADKIQRTRLPRGAARWILENDDVLQAIGN